MLTRKSSFAAIVIAAIVMLYACRKFDATSKQTAITPTEFKLADAKEWYYGVFKKNASFKTTDYNSPFAGTPLVTNNSETNSGIFYKKYPYWNKAIEYNYGSLQIVEMPILLEAKVIVFMGDEDLSVSERKLVAEGSLQKVLFFKEQNSKTTVRLVTMIPSLKYLKSKGYDISNNTLKNPDAGFEGHVVIRNWHDKIINVFEVKDSKYMRRVRLQQSLTRPANNKTQNSQMALEEECGWIERVEIERYCIATSGSSGDAPPADPSCDGQWQEREVRTWEYVPCSGEEPDPFEDCMQMGNSNEVCQCEIYGVGCPDVPPGDEPPGGNPPQGDDQVIDQIEVDLNDSCLQRAVDQINVADAMGTAIGGILHETFTYWDQHDLFIKQRCLADTTIDATTTPGTSLIVITFNECALTNSSQEYIAVSLFHEILHANFAAMSRTSGLNDHTIMASTYMNALASTLREIFPQLSQSDAEALSWGGLGSTTAWQNLVQSDPNKAAQIVAVNEKHKKGQLGTKCR